MSITLYSKYRRQGLRRAWHFAQMTEWTLDIGLKIAVFFVALLFVQWVSDKAIAEDMALEAKHRAEQKQEQAEATWLSCLNNKGVYIDDKLHICNLANTHLSRSDFK